MAAKAIEKERPRHWRGLFIVPVKIIIMEENNFEHIGVDWGSLLKAYTKVPQMSDLVMPQWPRISLNDDDDVESSSPVWEYGKAYREDEICRMDVFRWRVKCLETCYDEMFLEDFEYEAVEIPHGFLFVLNDNGEYVCAVGDSFTKVAMVMSPSEKNGYDFPKPSFEVDVSNDNGWGINTIWKDSHNFEETTDIIEQKRIQPKVAAWKWMQKEILDKFDLDNIANQVAQMQETV